MPEQTESFRVAWVDTDAGGRIHFTAAFRWVEATETAMFRRLGVPADEYRNFPRRHVSAEYRRVLVFEDEIAVRLRVGSVGTTSITFTWEIARGDDLAIEGTHTIVLVDGAGRPRPLPPLVRELFS
jgi:YbgC/YbaW family acyl-CoA thioester hydrolase